MYVCAGNATSEGAMLVIDSGLVASSVTVTANLEEWAHAARRLSPHSPIT